MTIAAAQHIKYLQTGPAGKDGKDGEKGTKGAKLMMLEWKSGEVYLSGEEEGEEWYHVVKCDDAKGKTRLYLCTKSFATSSPSTLPPYQDSTHWQIAADQKFVATDLLLAERIVADQINAEGLEVQILRTRAADYGSGDRSSIVAEENTLEMYNSGGSPRLRVTAGELSRLATSDSYSLSAEHGSGSGDKLQPCTALLEWYAVCSASDSATLVIPDVTLNPLSSLTFTRENATGRASYAWRLLARWYLDGQPVSIGSDGGAVDSGAFVLYAGDNQADVTLGSNVTVPGGSLRIAAGGHDIALELTLVTDDYEDGAVEMDVYSTAGGGSIVYASDLTEIASNGFRIAFDTTQVFEAKKEGGAVSFIMRCGSHGLRVDSTGIWKLSNGVWVAANI